MDDTATEIPKVHMFERGPNDHLITTCIVGLIPDLPGRIDGWWVDVTGLSADVVDRLNYEHAREHAHEDAGF